MALVGAVSRTVLYVVVTARCFKRGVDMNAQRMLFHSPSFFFIGRVISFVNFSPFSCLLWCQSVLTWHKKRFQLHAKLFATKGTFLETLQKKQPHLLLVLDTYTFTHIVLYILLVYFRVVRLYEKVDYLPTWIRNSRSRLFSPTWGLLLHLCAYDVPKLLVLAFVLNLLLWTLHARGIKGNFKRVHNTKLRSKLQ